MKRIAQLAVVLGALAVLAYLRDPAWLLAYSHGITADGDRRWTSGHAAFFVPADLHGVTLRLRSLKEEPDWPITATITIDDRPAERVTFADTSWRTIPLRLPPRGSRRARRIDLKLDRLAADGKGLEIGDIEYVR